MKEPTLVKSIPRPRSAMATGAQAEGKSFWYLAAGEEAMDYAPYVCAVLWCRGKSVSGSFALNED